jgi:ADP-ribose pyrophosphatase YjhB (NUDIX family)
MPHIHTQSGQIDLVAEVFCVFQNTVLFRLHEKYCIWLPPGGHVELNETPEEAAVREVKEETNMRVLQHRFVGVQEIVEPGKITVQTRSVCIVEPDGDFVADPDGEITNIEFIAPKDYKTYFDWGEIGDHVMERSLQLKIEMTNEILNA